MRTSLGSLAALTLCALALAQFAHTPTDPTADDGLSPMGRYKQGLIDDALAGLSFTGGRVSVDGSVAARGREADRLAAEAAALYEHNQVILAMASYRDALLESPGNGYFYHGLGLALAASGKGAPAEAAYRTAIDRRGGHPETLRALGDLLWSIARREEAIVLWEQTLALEPEDGLAHGRLAVARYYSGDLAGADQHLDAARSAGAAVPSALPDLLARALAGEPPASARVPENAGGADVGPQVRVDVGGGTFAANETSIAAVNVNGQEIVATWNDWRRSPDVPTELINAGAAVSLDGGVTWNDGLVRPPAPNQSPVEGDPMTAYDPRTGNLWVGAISFADNGGLYVARKALGEPLFEPSVQVGQQFFADKCWMAAGPAPGNPAVTALYIGYNEGLYRSFDLGATWSFRNADWPSGLGFLPRVAANGTLYVAYWDLFNGMMIIVSDDGGDSFGSPIRAATRLDVWNTQDGTRFPGDFRVPILPALAIDPADGNLYYAYHDTTDTAGGNSNVDIYLTRSNTGGASWSTPRIINADASPPGDQFFPWIEIDDGGRLHLVFHDSRNVVQDDFGGFGGDPNGFFDVYYAYSDDGGASWAETRLTPNTFNSADDGLARFNQFLGDYNGLAFAGDAAFPLYLSNQNGDSDTFTHRIVKSGGGGPVLGPPVPGIAGVDNTFTVTAAAPGTEVVIGFSLTAGSTPVGGCPGLELGLEDPTLLGSKPSNADGEAIFTIFIPEAASGRTALFQAGERFGCRLTDVVSFDFP